MVGTLKHLPFAIDEFQVLNEHKILAEKIVYGLANEFGRLVAVKQAVCGVYFRGKVLC